MESAFKVPHILTPVGVIESILSDPNHVLTWVVVPVADIFNIEPSNLDAQLLPMDCE